MLRLPLLLLLLLLTAACTATPAPGEAFVDAYNDYAEAVCACEALRERALEDLGKGPYFDDESCLSDLPIDEDERECVTTYDQAPIDEDMARSLACLAKRFQATRECIKNCWVTTVCPMPECDDMLDSHAPLSQGLNYCLGAGPHYWP